VSREIYFDLLRKRVFHRAKQLRITPKLSPRVEAELKELYQKEAHS